MVDVLSQILRLEDNDQAQALSGKRDEHLRLLEEAFGVKIVARGLDLIISGPEEAVAKAKNALQNMAGLGSSLTNHDVYYAIKMSDNGESAPLQELNAGIVVVTHRGHRIRPKTAGQRRYISAMATHDIRVQHRPGRYGQNVPGHGPSGGQPEEERSGAARFDASRGGSRRAPWVFAWGSAGQGGPLPAPPV